MKEKEIIVFRLGHRLPRDERITTHVCLVARAFGASSIIYSGQKDHSLETSVGAIVENWGGKFSVEYCEGAVGRLRKLKKEGFSVVHSTMYGEIIDEKKGEIASLEKAVVVVGGEKVPMEVYYLADFNIAVGSQPHSEVAALAIILDRMNGGKEMERGFDSRFDGKIRLEPTAKGKRIIKKE